MGMALPFYDQHLGVPHTLNREWPSVIRCAGLTIGLFYACAVCMVGWLANQFLHVHS
jgi:hypothetical protein